ncbi:flagellar basal body-associated FliL family protein [Acanthopleuribacter pedis]|uniref:Flagellar protein FliL n=1 Tax=Acanthopleuribacter pedis TaxID=442870 RepID=A0A8J7U5V1_9BACT|nr:flagellar basal body-associated FliL family protein [Acanthopleuribacter pedis]MBO1322938.1 flagellar basal body-associated FliL family protein [Acanthopleuribacter pedis]
MAWEEESIDTGADFEEVGGKRNPIKLIVIALVVIGVLVGAYFAYNAVMNKEDAPAEGENAEGTGEQVEEVVEEVVPEAGHKIALEKFTLNLADKGKPHFLVTTIALEVTKVELKTAVEADDKLYNTKTRDTILRILRTKTFKEVSDQATMKEVSKEIQHKLNRIYGEDGKVMNVYFTEFMVQ